MLLRHFKVQIIFSSSGRIICAGRTASIKERSLILRLNGLILNENPGSSNINEGKNPSGLKSKVSHSMTIIVGLVMSKLRPNWFKTMAKLVNIPALYGC